MSVKGYTREEMQAHQHAKRIRVFYTVAALQFLMIFVNIIAAILSYGIIAAIITLILFFTFWGAFAAGISKLSEEGQNVKKFNLLKFVSLFLYIISFAVAVFS